MSVTAVDVAILVIAKQPLPGRVKTRLCPPCAPEEAAALAGAALSDTLTAVAATPARRRVLVFDGDPEGWCPADFDVILQRGEGLAERLAAAFEDVDVPALIVGMDTPQLTPAHLTRALALMADPLSDAVIGPTEDGGYWCIGFSRPLPGAFTKVTMSTEVTLAEQLARLDELGVRVAMAEPLCDVDTFSDACEVAARAPATRFARVLADVAAAAAVAVAVAGNAA